MDIKRIIAAFMAAVTVCGSMAVTAGARVIPNYGSYNSGGWIFDTIQVRSEVINGRWTSTELDGIIFEGAACGSAYSAAEEESGFANLSAETIVIPSEVNGVPVVAIGESAFNSKWVESRGKSYAPSHKKIYIPSSVTVIDTRGRGMYEDDEPNPFAFCQQLTDVYYGGSEADWYNCMSCAGPAYAPVVIEDKWDGKFSKDSNWAYDGIENVTLHVNCESIDDEGDVVNFGAKVEKPAKVSGIKKARSKTYIKLSWNKGKDAESYVIKYSTDKKTWKTKTVKTNSVKLSKLKAGTKYYIKVAAKNSAGTGAYSKVFSVTTKK